MTARGKILVIRGGAIGDFILTVPVLRALRQNFPEASLVLLGYPHIAQLAQAAGLVHEVRSIEARGLASFFARRGELAQEWASYFAEFAVIVSYLFDPDQFFETNVRQSFKGQFLAGPHRPNEAESIHAAETFLRPLEKLAIFGADPAPALRLDDETEPVRTQRKTLAVHPGSGSEQKNWPEANWSELLQKLASEQSLHLLMAGGECEGERLDRLAKLWPSERLSIARNLSLPKLGALIGRSHAFLGHDSGISHLAAAVGTPGLVLWGETNPLIWRPLSQKMKLLHTPGGLANLPVSTVAEHIRQLLSL